ncbi:unnamed protein product [Caenorhabditis auriculariae]|uniref:Uncharacterized protein n=1 Tax=Caenorhabditis auriculariae TaxID=2777116 RepID=A0A8S1GZV6_9PELO|nr:unnamed protein product [Caenorhabditis auriculariae]
MWLYLTISILFLYTILLIVFFMGWCTLIPNRCHSRRSIPFSTVKSPRRHTKFIEIDCVSSSTSLDMFPHRKSTILSGLPLREKKFSLPLDASKPSYKVSDYLHPKYSLPPVKIAICDRQWEFEQLLRTPAHSKRSLSTPSHKGSDASNASNV